MRSEVYRDGALIEWWGVEGAEFVHVVHGAEVERRPATVDELAADQPPPALPAGELIVDRFTVPANATSYAVARYGADDRVLFVVNGVVHPVNPVAGVAELSVAADAPGVIAVAVRDRQFVIVAEGT